MIVEQIRAGNRRALAQFLTKVESNRAAVAAELAQLNAQAAAAIVGVTGAPGVGKSTLVASLTKVLRARNLSVAIVAVDPSSPYSGGAILGDRIRMQNLAGDRGVFIRSMASRGNQGGLARATMDVASVLRAAGFDYVIVETVGAGQSDLEIARLAHTTIVVEAPGAGDGVQALKAGILEIADILVVNKCDRPGAGQAARMLKSMLRLNHPSKAPSGDDADWIPPILCTSALQQTGLEALAEAICEHRRYCCEHDLIASLRKAQIRAELEMRLKETAYRLVFDTITPEELAGIIERINAREIDPQGAVYALLAERKFGRLE